MGGWGGRGGGGGGGMNGKATGQREMEGAGESFGVN